MKYTNIIVSVCYCVVFHELNCVDVSHCEYSTHSHLWMILIYLFKLVLKNHRNKTLVVQMYSLHCSGFSETNNIYIYSFKFYNNPNMSHRAEALDPANSDQQTIAIAKLYPIDLVGAKTQRMNIIENTICNILMQNK